MQAHEGRRPRVILGITGACTSCSTTYHQRSGLLKDDTAALCDAGSVAAIKAPQLAALLATWADVRIVPTEASKHFFKDADMPSGCHIYKEEDDWRHWKAVGDPVTHIELRRWADLLVIAPLSANTLAKLAHGMCDNLLTCIVRAWDYQDPLLVAPAMNTMMYDNPLTAQQLSVLTRLGASVVPPVSKTLACGDVGNGAMAAPDTIAGACRAALDSKGLTSRAASLQSSALQ